MDQLLTIAGTVAVVQLLFAAWREWCSAHRIVAVGGLDADVYAKHGRVPLQFAGSSYGIVRAAVAVTGFLMVRPKTRKQVFAACKVVGVRGSSEIGYREIRPRDSLRIMLDEGEHPTVFDRSMRRGAVSFYRTVAIRELECPGANEHAHCVVIDPYAGYKAAVRDAAPRATRVADHFHIVGLANAALTDVRTRRRYEHEAASCAPPAPQAPSGWSTQ